MQARADVRTPLNRILDRMRPYLEPRPASRPVALVPARTAEAPPIDPRQLAELAALHGVPEEVLVRQVEVLREIASSIRGVPASYRNTVDKVEDVQRAALWLMSGATTQAGFRRFFGTEGFMRPTKSVAWDFFNRVFKRGPFGPPA